MFDLNSILNKSFFLLRHINFLNFLNNDISEKSYIDIHNKLNNYIIIDIDNIVHCISNNKINTIDIDI